MLYFLCAIVVWLYSLIKLNSEWEHSGEAHSLPTSTFVASVINIFHNPVNAHKRMTLVGITGLQLSEWE